MISDHPPLRGILRGHRRNLRKLSERAGQPPAAGTAGRGQMFHAANGCNFHHPKGAADLPDQQLRPGAGSPHGTHPGQFQGSGSLPRAAQHAQFRVRGGNPGAPPRRNHPVRQGLRAAAGEGTNGRVQTAGAPIAPARGQLLRQLEKVPRGAEPRGVSLIPVAGDRLAAAATRARPTRAVLSQVLQAAHAQRPRTARQHSRDHDRNQKV